MQGKDLEFHTVYFARKGDIFFFTGTALASKFAEVAPLFKESGETFKPAK
jgi:hypothetical protein